jgi:hypothetical protein
MPLASQSLVVVFTRLLVAALVALVGGVVWAVLADESIVSRFGAVLVVVGFVLMMAPSGMYTRMEMQMANMWLGRGPDRPVTDSGDGPGLTAFGSFLFVSIPLIALGFVLI